MRVVDVVLAPAVLARSATATCVCWWAKRAQQVVTLPYQALVVAIWAVNSISSDLLAAVSKQPNMRAQVLGCALWRRHGGARSRNATRAGARPAATPGLERDDAHRTHVWCTL